MSNTMTIVSLNVGLPREWEWQGKKVISSIDKRPVDGQVELYREDFAGDQQADLSVHGGPAKAVYGYPASHYPWWRTQLPGKDLPYGMFGENLTIEGLTEDEIFIGDHYQVGTAKLVVTQPRLPCYKLAMRFGIPQFLKQFLNSRRTGYYFGVLEEGKVQSGDSLTLLHREDHHVSIVDVVRLYAFDRYDRDGLQRVVTAYDLPASWREEFQERLDSLAEA